MVTIDNIIMCRDLEALQGLESELYAEFDAAHERRDNEGMDCTADKLACLARRQFELEVRDRRTAEYMRVAGHI